MKPGPINLYFVPKEERRGTLKTLKPYTRSINFILRLLFYSFVASEFEG